MSILDDLFDSNAGPNESLAPISPRLRTIVIPTLTDEQEALVASTREQLTGVPPAVLFILGDAAPEYAGKLAISRSHIVPMTGSWVRSGGLHFISYWSGKWSPFAKGPRTPVSFARLATYEDIVGRIVHTPPPLEYPIKDSPEAIFASWVIAQGDAVNLSRKITQINQAVQSGNHELVKRS